MALLENGGFEGGYRPLSAPDGSKPHHQARVYEVDTTGGPITKRYTVERGEIHNPVGWWSWYAHQRNDETPVPWDPANRIGWAEPEIRLTETVHNRHRSGERAGYVFTWRRIHEGGLYQEVPVVFGRRLRFTAFGHAWISNDDSQPPSCSLPGCGPLWWKAGTPWLSDDQRSVRLSVGIDPTGGIDPYASTVVWGDEWHIFNGYRYEPLWVEAVAQNSTVTVFLRSSTLWPVIHNDVAWDDCALEYVVDEPEPPGECRGTPRVQYERTYLLLHASEPQDMWSGAVKAMLDLQVRWTLGPSADDAGMGDLDLRRVIAVNPALWGDDLEAFFDEHYPGVLYQPVYAATPGGLALELRELVYGSDGYDGMTLFSQRDPRWASERLGASPLTIGNAGCAMVSACMVATQVEAELTPLELNWRLNAIGGYTSDGLLYWRKVADAVSGLRFKSYATWRTVPKPDADMALVRAAIARGPCVIQVDYAPGGALDTHFVVATRMLPGEDIEIVDPWTGEVTTLRTRYWNQTLPQSIYALAEYAIEGDMPPLPDPGNLPASRLLGLHLQDWGDKDAVLEFCRRVQPGVMKVFDAGMAPEIKAVAPNTALVYRHHIDREMELACLRNPGPMAVWFLDQFAEQVRPYVDAAQITHIETAINETMDGELVAAAVAFELVFIAELKRRLPQALPVVATIAVGNPHESQYPLLLPLAEAVARAGGAFGYHAYWPVERGTSFLESDWQWHAGRFEGMDNFFRRNSYAVDWILSECGPCGGVMQGNEAGRWFAYDPAAGWKHEQCFNGDWDRTLADIQTFRRRLENSPAIVRGATWFTVCPWDWQWFNVGRAQIESLAG